jgi:hypothetical protein
MVHLNAFVLAIAETGHGHRSAPKVVWSKNSADAPVLEKMRFPEHGCQTSRPIQRKCRRRQCFREHSDRHATILDRSRAWPRNFTFRSPPMIATGLPNCYVKSFNGTLRDELLNREIFLSFEEACWVIDRWQLDYNHHRIHSSLDYQTPADFAVACVLPASATPQPPEHSRFTNPNPLIQPGAKTGGVVIL